MKILIKLAIFFSIERQPWVYR